MINKITPIETIYNGYRFRSRLEARWAVFFDNLDIQYEYEKDGYDLGNEGWYLPDFYLPNMRSGMFIEVKPMEEDSDNSIASKKIEALTKLTGKDSAIVFGDPFEQVARYGGDQGLNYGYTLYMGDDEHVGMDFPFFFCVCPWCLKAGFEFDGRGARVCGYQKHYEKAEDALNAIEHLGHWRVDDKCYTGNHSRIYNAALIARQARFEHGNTPKEREK
jgi:hypothetical protein